MWLRHAAVESNEVKNLYDGEVITNSVGVAEITLPDYFEALNTSFKYQLYTLDSFYSCKLIKKIENNKFSIQTVEPNTTVHWQVVAIRNDPSIHANPLQVESFKD